MNDQRSPDGPARSASPSLPPSLMDALERRVLLTAFVYREFPSFLDSATPIHVLGPDGNGGWKHSVGTSVAGIGDVDGDGMADILVGAAGKTRWDGGDSGSMAAVYSGATGQVLYAVSDHFREFGASVAGLGDVNGDGTPDFVVGSPRFSTEGRNDPKHHVGAAYIFSGVDGSLLHEFIHESESDRSDRGFPRGERFGASVASAGDLNGDGVLDVIIGAPGVDGEGTDRGRAFVYSGADGALLATFDGAADGYRLGASVSTAGDVDGDGVADLLVGAPGSFMGRYHVPGHVYVFSGANSTVLFTFSAGTVRDLFGLSVASAGDVDNDGTPDFVIGAPGRTPPDIGLDKGGNSGHGGGDDDDDDNSGGGGDDDDDDDDSGGGDDDSDGDDDDFFHNHAPYAGRAFVYSGSDGSLLHSFRGAGPHDNMGTSVAGAGDFNFDGHADVIVGSPSARPQGRATVYSGVDGSVIAAFGGRSTPGVHSDRLGTSVAMVGDVNGDGFDDLAVGANQRRGFGRDGHGRVFVFSGAIGATLLPAGINEDGDIWGATGTSESAPGFLIRDGTVATLQALGGFEPGDRIIDVNASGTVLGMSADGAAFTWIEGERVILEDTVTVFNGPDGTFEGFRPVDITDSGLILIERLLVGDPPTTTPTAWLLEGDVLTHLVDGTPVAVNESGTVIATVIDADTGLVVRSLVWSADQPLVELEGFEAFAINNEGVVVGAKLPEVTTEAEGDFRLAFTFKDGEYTPLGVIEGGTGFVPATINDEGEVIGHYTTADGAISGFFYAPDQEVQDIKALVKAGGTARFFESADTSLADINGAPIIVGSLNDAHVGFLLVGFEDDGSTGGGEDLDTASARDADGDLHVISINDAGRIIVLTKNSSTGQWTALDVTASLGAPEALEVVAWTDATTGNAVFAAASYDGLLLFTQGEDGAWAMRNLTEELAGSTPIVSGLVHFVTRNGIHYIAGIDTNADIVLYRQIENPDSDQSEWEYENISNCHLRPLGLRTPILTGKLIAYVTDWNGLNLAGLDEHGNLQSVWIAPGMERWVVSDLTTLTGGPARQGGLSVNQTAWGGINLMGVDREGRTIVTWWVPVFGTFWRNDDLTANTGGPKLKAASITAYTTAWGALTVAGLDENDRMTLYWWVPGMQKWVATAIDTDALDEDDDPYSKPCGCLSSSADADGSTNIYWTGDSGTIKRLHWKPGQEWWQLETASPD